jgi:hypothetical protein
MWGLALNHTVWPVYMWGLAFYSHVENTCTSVSFHW